MKIQIIHPDFYNAKGEKLKHLSIIDMEEGKAKSLIARNIARVPVDETSSEGKETAELEAENKKLKSELAKVKKENKALTEKVAELEGGNQEAK